MQNSDDQADQECDSSPAQRLAAAPLSTNPPPQPVTDSTAEQQRNNAPHPISRNEILHDAPILLDFKLDTSILAPPLFGIVRSDRMRRAVSDGSHALGGYPRPWSDHRPRPQHADATAPRSCHHYRPRRTQPRRNRWARSMTSSPSRR